MHRRNFITHARWRTTASATLALAFAFALSTAAAGALAQTTAKPEGLTLSQAFEAAWARQPELAALAARRDAARAQQQAAQSWTPEPVAVEVTGKTDRLNRNLGTREYEAGLTHGGGHPQLELLEAFNRESSLRKAALIEGPNEQTGMLTARVLDFQSTATERAVADLWIVKFLHARLQMSDLEGTQLLARTLRQAHTKTRGDVDAQDQINAAITGLRVAAGQRWSIDSVAATYLSGDAERAFLANVRPEERAAVFGLDHDRFDQLIQYTRFTLANGVIVSAPFVEIGNEEGGVTITEIDGKRILQAEGEIQEEQVRTRG